MPTVICCLAVLAALAGPWEIDRDRSSVRFTVTKFGREVVEGRFGDFRGAVSWDPAAPERSFLRWSVRVASVDTGEPERDRALRGPEFFDSARFPELTFVSNRVRRLPDGRVHVTGVITIRGVERPLVVTGRSLSRDPRHPVFETRFALDRHAFGVSGGSISRHGISDTAQVHLVLAGVPR